MSSRVVSPAPTIPSAVKATRKVENKNIEARPPPGTKKAKTQLTSPTAIALEDERKLKYNLVQMEEVHGGAGSVNTARAVWSPTRSPQTPVSGADEHPHSSAVSVYNASHETSIKGWSKKPAAAGSLQRVINSIVCMTRLSGRTTTQEGPGTTSAGQPRQRRPVDNASSTEDMCIALIPRKNAAIRTCSVVTTPTVL
eukprot:TRINITY_DN3997_c0_g1_i9.p1 TRINITY_DN3997_c0_g1~~TRINITY_DN3997_c0_g1_i9.p1  ORF type:complete len:197 (-),score=26.08 TRINITY_DN3997_c0_g1_i9:40-630(-)